MFLPFGFFDLLCIAQLVYPTFLLCLRMRAHSNSSQSAGGCEPMEYEQSNGSSHQQLIQNLNGRD